MTFNPLPICHTVRLRVERTSSRIQTLLSVCMKTTYITAPYLCQCEHGHEAVDHRRLGCSPAALPAFCRYLWHLQKCPVLLALAALPCSTSPPSDVDWRSDRRCRDTGIFMWSLFWDNLVIGTHCSNLVPKTATTATDALELGTWVTKGPFRPRASTRRVTRVDAAYLQVMYAYSSSCQLRHFQLRHCIVNDVISTGVAAGADTNILAIYCY